MERRKPLRADPNKTRAWQRRSRERALKRERDAATNVDGRADGLKRGAPKRKAKAAPDPRERRLMELFFRGQYTQPCAVPTCRRTGRCDPHHTIRQQVLARLARAAGLDPVALVWDRRWRMWLCRECHGRHTARSRRVSGALVPPEAWIAAEELDDALEAAGKPRTAIIELRREHP